MSRLIKILIKMKDEVLLRPKYFGVWGGLIIALLLVGLWSSSSRDRQALANQAQRQVSAITDSCVDWINEEYNRDRGGSLAAVALDTWEKDDHIVVSVGWKEDTNSRTYQTRLCVTETANGRTFSPGAFGRGRWEKY